MATEIQKTFAELKTFESEHPFWNNSLFQACQAGTLSKADFSFIFGQYYFYSKNFTRYLAGLMANLEDDLLRAKLSENIWEEGGGSDPCKRHAEIFRTFLIAGLNLNLDAIQPLEGTQQFVRAYLDFCLKSNAIAGSAFLSLGTEALVPRMYTIFLRGLLAAGVEEISLNFFKIHIACDDDHSETLARILLSVSTVSDWAFQSHTAIEYALNLRWHFFEYLMDNLSKKIRREPMFER